MFEYPSSQLASALSVDVHESERLASEVDNFSEDKVSLKKGRVAVVDDVSAMRSLLKEFLESHGFEVTCFESGTDLLGTLDLNSNESELKSAKRFDVIISDVRMPGMNGLDLMSLLHQKIPELPVILTSAYGNVQTALEAIKRGAVHYVIKPFKLAEILLNVERALLVARLKRENVMLRGEFQRQFRMGEMFGKSAEMQAVFNLIGRVSKTTANVLISGESGTGKELVARAIHLSGDRAQRPFIAINCTAIPEALLESELFGHARGAFTGALQNKKGLLEEAEGGTLFLDEIGDMNIALQSKLLRVIQDRQIRPVGENRTRDVDVRLISATHKDLRLAMKEGLFREDLYYRLSVIPIVLPPLRQRREDIPLLAEHFLEKYSIVNNSRVRGFEPAAMNKLMTMKWEGNVRELENVIERAVVLSQSEWILESDIPTPDEHNLETSLESTLQGFPTLSELEKRYIHIVLERTAGRKDKAAQILGINRRTLYRKEREYGWATSSEEPPTPLLGDDDHRISVN